MTERTPEFEKKYVIFVEWTAPFNGRRYDGTNLFSLSLICLYVYFYMFISLQIQAIGT